MIQNFKLLHEIASLRTGFHVRSAPKPDSTGSHFLLQVGDFGEDRTLATFDNVLKFSPVKVSPKHLCVEGDVIFLSKGVRPFAHVLGPLTQPLLVSSNFLIITLNEDAGLDPEFLAWHLNQQAILDSLVQYSRVGEKVPVIQLRTLERMSIPVPNSSIQEKIVRLMALRAKRSALHKELLAKQALLINAHCQRASGIALIDSHLRPCKIKKT